MFRVSVNSNLRLQKGDSNLVDLAVNFKLLLLISSFVQGGPALLKASATNVWPGSSLGLGKNFLLVKGLLSQVKMESTRLLGVGGEVLGTMGH
jgi:hypothetical protein